MIETFEITRKYKHKIFDENIYFPPDIPEKKLRNAIKSYADIGDETPLVLIDDTVFGSAKAGILLTNFALYIKDSTEKRSFRCALNSIEQVSFKNYVVLKRLIINEAIVIDFTQPSKKALSLFSDMISELCGIRSEENFSWSNVGIGAGVGALFGGPIGAAIGAAIGASLENKEAVGSKFNYEDDPELVFVVTLSSMMAKMAQSDGSITKDEVSDALEVFDKLGFSGEKLKIAKNAYRNAQTDNATIYDYARQYRSISDYDLQEFLYSILWTIALSDGELHPEERYILEEIPPMIGLPKSKFYEYWNDFESDQEEDYNSNDKNNTYTLQECYIILGCAEDDDFKTIKRKYRALISEYHPDKIQAKGLPDSFLQFATEQMQKINLAYETIKSHRGE